MLVHLWYSLIVALMALSLLMGCASSPYVGTGAAVGGGLGALTGAAIGHKNPWAGALIGGLVGTGVGAAGGYALQQRQASQQPQQGYYQQPPQGYYQQPPSGYSAPPPQGYGSRPSAPGPSYGGSYGGYNTPSPVTPGAPQYSETPPPQYNQAPPQYQDQASPSSVHTPISPAPYQTYE